ncbi:hypothetical protein N2152v2_002364 [Parachlorella kessleri]
MESGELHFDFERALEAQKPSLAVQAQDAAQSQQPQPKNYRQTVCTYWLRGLCMKGDTCGFLHQFDPQRMPVCRTLLKFGVCKEPDCPYKHTLDEIKECNMYKLGFCIYGPACRFKHTRLQGPAPEPSTLEACKPRELRNINMVANQANMGIVQQEAQRPTRRPRLVGPPGDYLALPAPAGNPQQAQQQQASLPPSYPPRPQMGQQHHHQQQQQQQQQALQQPMQHGSGALGGAFSGGLPQRPPYQGVPPPRPPPNMQQQQQQQFPGGVPWQQQQQQQFGRPHGFDPALLASVGQANLPYGF